MSSGADLFVVCKQCGSEVSPYITECPYCGNRLRRRAPKLLKVGAPEPQRGRRGGLGGLLGGGRGKTRRAPRRRAARAHSDRWATSRPYATIAIVVIPCICWVAVRAEPYLYTHMLLIGGVHGEWWRLVTTQWVYFSGSGGGVYAFLAIGSAGLFGWLLERRHGPA